MRTFLAFVFSALFATMAFAQSPVFNNLTVQGKINGKSLPSGDFAGTIDPQTLSNKSLESPTITGTATAPTQSQGDNSSKLATTSYVDTGLASAPYTAPGAGGYATTVGATLNYRNDVRNYGSASTCNGVVDDSAAITNALARNATLYIGPGATCTIGTNLTIPSGKELFIASGSTISVNSTFTLTIRGVVRAPPVQIFTGAGTVTGIGDVWPEWWGAKGTGASNDDASAIQKAQLSIQNAAHLSDGARRMNLQCRFYGVGSTVTLTPIASTGFEWKGCGSTGAGQSTLIGLASFTGTSVLQIAGSGSNPIVNITLDGFAVTPQTIGSGATEGLRIGSSASSILNATKPSIVRNVHIQDFNTNWHIQDAKLFVFEAVDGWCVSNASCTPLLIDNSASASSFTGDLTFISGQFVAYNSAGSVAVAINSATSGANIAGIRFLGTIFYYGVVSGNASGGTIADIWFDGGFQFDSVKQKGISFASSSTGVVVNIHVNDGYFTTASTQTANPAIVFSAATLGNTRNIWITGNQVYGNTVNNFYAINVDTVKDVSISDNTVYEWANPPTALTGLIYVRGGLNITVANNRADRSSGTTSFQYFVAVTTGADYYSVVNNLSNGIATNGTAANNNVNNLAGGSHATITGNW